MASQEGMGSYRHRLHRLLSLPNMDNQRGLEGSPVLWYDRILISYHIITYHIISYQVISYHIMSYHCHIIVISCCYHIVIISLSFHIPVLQTARTLKVFLTYHGNTMAISCCEEHHGDPSGLPRQQSGMGSQREQPRQAALASQKWWLRCGYCTGYFACMLYA